MRFLIDECLHPTLADVAHGAGHEAHHVNFLGLASTKDHDLMPRILEGDCRATIRMRLILIVARHSTASAGSEGGVWVIGRA